MRWLGHCLCALIIAFAFGICVLSVKAQIEPPKTASANASRKPDWRYAIVRGAWSAATISLFNTWSAFDYNRGRRASFYSLDHKKLIEIVGTEVLLRMGGKTFKTDIDNETKHDAELGWAPTRRSSSSHGPTPESWVAGTCRYTGLMQAVYMRFRA